MTHFTALALARLLVTSASVAQLASPPQPYAEMQSRPVRALPEQQAADLRAAGRGIGLALPAELNGYPGPSHTLENADALSLSPEQRERNRALFEVEKAEAILVGERLIRQEAELEGLFATQAIQPASLDAATTAIGVTQGQLRATHLRYHLAMIDVLTPEQVRRYGEVRGYGSAGASRHNGDAQQHRRGTHHR